MFKPQENDPLKAEIDLNPGFKYPYQGQDIHIKTAVIALLTHGDHLVCNAITDAEARGAQRFRWGIYQLGPFVGRDQVTDHMIKQMYEPDIERLQEAMYSLHATFRDSPNATCPACNFEFHSTLGAAQARA